MGCGSSTQRDPSAPGAIAREPNANGPLARTLSRRSAASDHNVPIAQHATSAVLRPSEPLAAPQPWRSTSREWTPSTLRAERDAFFDTRVTGNPHVWVVLKRVTEILCETHSQVGEEHRLREAQGLLDAAAITCPTGRLRDGCYDETGVSYKLPKHIISDPVNMGEDERLSEEMGEYKEGMSVVDGADETDEDGLERRDEKGKGRIGNPLKICARLSDRGTDVVVEVGDEQSVRTITRVIQERAAMSPAAKIKLAYMGKILRENETLIAQGWQPGHILSVLVFQA